MDFTQEIDNIIHTLEQLNIPATYDNMSKLLGCMQHLARMRDMLKAQTAEEVAGDA